MHNLFKKREKIMLCITIVVIVFGILFNYLISPILSQNQELNREINTNKTKLKKYFLLLSQKEQILSKLKGFSSGFQPLNSKGDAVVATFTALEDLAKDANIKIIDIRPEVGFQGKRQAKEFIIELRAEGLMEGYIKFIYSLENSLLLLRIKKFQFISKTNAQLLEGNFSIAQSLF